jgi:hypothetical protein
VSTATLSRRKKRAIKASLSSQAQKHPTWLIALLASLLVAGTIVLYSPVRTHTFITYDDYDYVVSNSRVVAGLNWATVRWVLTSTEEANWHPLTWLSHALDCQLFGLDSSYHHMTSVVIHLLNVLLLFLILQCATGALGRSAMLAALFAWHPFNVESVAWVAERKSVLSTFFFLLTLGVYGWYARKPQIKRYIAIVALFVLALASKPMAVTLPFVLLLLDYWPLQRVAGWAEISPGFPVPQQSARRLLLEKLPLFALSAASSAITVWAQGRAIQSLERFPFGARLGNAVLCYVTYMEKTLWPAGLTVLYPHPGASLPFWKPAVAASLLCGISIAVCKQRGTRPWLLVGWLWFLGTLVPVIGIVQVGEQAMADRYVYVPIIGLFVMAVWGSAEFFDQRRWAEALRWGLACVVAGALVFLSFRQIGYWKDSLTLWSHASMVTPENLTCERQLANALIATGDTQKAVPHIYNLARLDPRGVWTPVYLGFTDLWQGRIPEANQEFGKCVKLSEHLALDREDHLLRSSALLNLGITYLLERNYRKAVESFQSLNQFDPAEVSELIGSYDHSLTAAPSELGFIRLSLLLRAQGKERDASSLLENAAKANPEYGDLQPVLDYMNTSSK